MTASTIVFANTLAQSQANRLDGEKIRRIAEAATVEDALKMLSDYGFTSALGGSIDGFVVTETDKLIEFLRDTSPSEKVFDALTAPFWYNNVKLAYKSRFVAMPENSYYQVGGEPDRIARGDYSDCDKYLTAALCGLDEANERNPRVIDLELTRAMYKFVLSVGVHEIKNYFKREIDMKNILSAARMKRLGINRDEFLNGGNIKHDTLVDAINAGSFSGSFIGTPYEEMTEKLEENGFTEFFGFENDMNELLFDMTDSLCQDMSSYEPYLNYYTRALVELKTIKTALVCIKTSSRDVFYKRMPKMFR